MKVTRHARTVLSIVVAVVCSLGVLLSAQAGGGQAGQAAQASATPGREARGRAGEHHAARRASRSISRSRRYDAAGQADS